MNKTSIYAAAAFAVLLFAPTASQAQTANDLGIEFSGNVGFVTEYSFRGIAQSDERPAVQGGFDAVHESGFYAGVWGSNVDFNDNDEASAEIDGYFGYSGAWNDLFYDLGYIYYAYPGADSSLNYDFWEVSAALGYDFGMFSTSASVNYSPDFFGGSDDASYYAAGIDVPVYDFTLSGHVGYQDIEDEAAFGVPDYTDWSLGVSYSLEGFDLSLQYIDTDLKEPGECADGCAERVIFGISRSF